jgi:hypothetical protein
MKTIQKAAVSSMKSRLLLASTIAITMTVIGSRVLADDASDIESFYPVNAYVSYDNTSGAYPIITSLASQPGVFGGHTYTGWAILAQDSTGSLELFSSASTLTNLPAGPGTPYTASSAPAVGDMLNAAGQYGPFDGIPELAFSTVVSSNNYINKISSGNAVPTAPIFTIPQLQAGTANGTGILTNSAIAGMYLEIQGVTFSGSTGGFMSTFPLESQANTVNESYTITNASIRTGVTTRKGSGGCGSSRRRQQAETQRARSEEAAATGANRKRWPSRRAERARKSAGEGAKEQARTIDPGMAALRGVAVAGEGKADPSARSRQGDEIQSCGELEGIDPEAGETGFRGAEQRSTRRSRTQCSVRCSPMRENA